MELKLERFISNVELLTNIHEQNKNPILFRMQKGTAEMGLVFYCSYRIPRYVVLPKNAIWIDYDPESPTFRHAFKRVIKHPTDPMQDQWEQLYFYDDAMAAQEYDEGDLGTVNQSLPPRASKSVYGIGYLTYPEAESRVIVEGDETLSNPRPPLDHNHAEVPASMLSINGTYGTEYLPVEDQDIPMLNQVLVAGTNVIKWRKLKEEEL